MSDVTITGSRHRITFTPEDGEEMLLLDVGDSMDAAVSLTGGPQVSTNELIDRRWIHHVATGNAQATLAFDVHRAAASPAAAQALGLRMWRYLTTHPNGTLRFQTAFLHSKSCPVIDWEMQATCNSVTHAEVDIDSSPFDTAASCHLAYDFTVSLPDSNEFEV